MQVIIAVVVVFIALASTEGEAAKKNPPSHVRKHLIHAISGKHQARSGKQPAHRALVGQVCGTKNASRYSSNPGDFTEIDSCCFERDNCKYFIDALVYDELYHLKNDGRTSRIGCGCDRKFYKCLHRINTSRARQVGTTYFSPYSVSRCLNYDFPIVSCEEFSETNKEDGLIPRCMSYEKDTSQPKAWQWFDLPTFTEPFPDYTEHIPDPPTKSVQNSPPTPLLDYTTPPPYIASDTPITTASPIYYDDVAGDVDVLDAYVSNPSEAAEPEARKSRSKPVGHKRKRSQLHKRTHNDHKHK